MCARFLVVLTLLCTALSASAQTAERFNVFEYRIEGNTVLDDEAIERAVYDFLGPQKTVDNIEAARAALEKAYQDAGYLTVTVELPEQKVEEDGAVTLRVQEGQIERLKITGSQYHQPSRIRDGATALVAGNVPRFAEVQQQLAELGQLAPDRQITPLLRPGKAPGKIEVELKIDDQLPLHGSVEFNNKQSFSTRQGRTETSLRYDNLFQLGHSLGATWIYSPHAPDQANIWSFNYGVPLRGGDYLSASFVTSDSNIPAELGGATVVNGESVGLRYRKALPTRSLNIYHGLTVGFDYKSNKDALDRNAQTLVPRSLHYTTLAGRYDLLIPGDDGGSQTGIDLNLNLGLPSLTERKIDCDGVRLEQFACKSAGAEASFMVMRLGASHTRAVFGNWSFSARGELQLASGPLVPQEQLGAGGRDSVRGYYEYERFGDSGATLNLELTTPELLSAAGISVKALGFFDRAHLRTIDPLPLEDPRVNLGSYGLGMRLQGRGITARLELAVPVFSTGTLTPDGNGNNVFRVRTHKDNARVHVGVGYQF